MPRMTTVAFDAIALPENGLLAWSQSSNRFRVNKGFPGTPVYDQLAYFNDIPLDNTAFGEFFFQGNAIETVITVIGVPVKIDAVYNPGDLLGFTNGSGILTYTASDTKEFALSLSLTTTLNLSTAEISVVIFINGSPVSKTEQGTFTGSTTPGFQSTSVNALVELSTGDIIEVYVKNNTSTNNITVQDLNMNLSSVGGAIGNLADQVVVAWDSTTSPVSVVGSSLIDITGGIISTTAEVNVVTSVEGSTSPVSLTAGTGINITGGVIATTGGDGVSGNFQLGAVTEATTVYPFGAYTSMIETFDGQQTVLPGTLNIGESVQLNMTFNLYPPITASTVAGTFRLTFGPIVIESQNVIITNTSSRNGYLEFTITRIDATNVNIDVSGWYIQQVQSQCRLFGHHLP